MTILKEWLANRGVFDEVSYGETELQIVSLNKKLIDQLKELPRWIDMYEFVAKHGLSDERNRLSESEIYSEDIPTIWLIPDFIENKKAIVDDICALSDIESILSDKLKAEEEEAEMKELEDEDARNKVKEALANNPHIELAQLEADNEVEKL